MCGICGFVSRNKIEHSVLSAMTKSIAHRGPDDSGEEIYSLNDWIIGFGHRRLSINDLSIYGHQPMHSFNKRVSVILNGEIYNFKELKKELSDYPYKSNTDTEVILSAYIKWGIDFVYHINGMYAIALLRTSALKNK